MLPRLMSILGVILALISAALLINFLRLDWKRERTRGFLAGLWFSLIQINEIIFALVFRTGIKYRPDGFEISADDIIASWPHKIKISVFSIIFFTLSAWIFESFSKSGRRR
jgi:hypothetical protein